MSSSGRDFNPNVVLTVQAQVDKLILQATSLENLCQCFSGWYGSCYWFFLFHAHSRVLGVRSGDLYQCLGLPTRLIFLATGGCYDVHFISLHLLFVIYLVLPTPFCLCHLDVRFIDPTVDRCLQI